jgi:16S rRNA pseudouridine516 synthase
MGGACWRGPGAGNRGADASIPPMPHPGEPLDRFVVRAARLGWADTRRAVHAKRVAVNGVMTQKYHRPLRPDDRVALDGADLGDPPDDSVILCHKPAGLACSHGAQDAPLIYDAIPAHLRRPDLNTVGRLDRSTTGLLLITCDGKLLVRIADPARKLPKRYRIAYSGELCADAVERCAAGLMIDGYDTPCRPAPLSLEGPGRATLVIAEGRHHQVKRMIAALGGKVVGLHRDAVGGLELPADLAPGSMRPRGPAARARLLSA